MSTLPCCAVEGGGAFLLLSKFRKYCCSRPNVHAKVAEARDATCILHASWDNYKCHFTELSVVVELLSVTYMSRTTLLLQIRKEKSTYL